MARPRTATKILELKGAFKRNPQRKRSEPTCANQLKKTAPRYLNSDQKAAWRKIIKIAPPGVLQESDEMIVASVACLWAEFLQGPALMHPQKLLRLEIQLGRLGMTPSDRSKVTVEKPKQNEFDDF